MIRNTLLIVVDKTSCTLQDGLKTDTRDIPGQSRWVFGRRLRAGFGSGQSWGSAPVPSRKKRPDTGVTVHLSSDSHQHEYTMTSMMRQIRYAAQSEGNDSLRLRLSVMIQCDRARHGKYEMILRGWTSYAQLSIGLLARTNETAPPDSAHHSAPWFTLYRT